MRTLTGMVKRLLKIMYLKILLKWRRTIEIVEGAGIMSEYDLLLKNLEGMCKLTIETINNHDGCEGLPEITTPLDVAYNLIIDTKKNIDEFEHAFLPEERYKLMYCKKWVNKKNVDEHVKIIQIDLRHMTLFCTYLTKPMPFNDEMKIFRFLNEFEPC